MRSKSEVIAACLETKNVWQKTVHLLFSEEENLILNVCSLLKILHMLAYVLHLFFTQNFNKKMIGLQKTFFLYVCSGRNQWCLIQTHGFVPHRESLYTRSHYVKWVCLPLSKSDLLDLVASE